MNLASPLSTARGARERAVLRDPRDAPPRAHTGLTARRGARASSARPHSAAEWRRWPDAGGVMSPLRIQPSHWPSPRPSGADPALCSHVTFPTIHAARRGLQSGTLRSLWTSSQNLEMMG